MTVVKAGVIGGSAWVFGATPAMAVAIGFALAQTGEFGLIVLGAAEQAGVIDKTISVNATAIVVISLMLTPALVDIGRRWSTRWQDISGAPWIQTGLERLAAHDQPQLAAGTRKVILGGYGQVGRAVGAALEQAHVACTVVELTSKGTDSAKAEGHAAIFGDVSNAEVLVSSGIEQADALILTMPDEQPVLRACAIAKRLRPGIFIAARLNFASQQRIAHELGADLVVVEELETANAMKRAVFDRFGQ
jgi:CPA2 family monovalent cation:H+ antiporter-2